MRLINTHTHKFTYFPTKPPPYAILSHTWLPADQEATHQEWRDPAFWSLSSTFKPGYVKIINAIEHAAALGLEWLWIDTVCIDKTNLVELSEAINSMFGWYEGSDVCLAYLDDVEDDGVEGEEGGLEASIHRDNVPEAEGKEKEKEKDKGTGGDDGEKRVGDGKFAQSRWFTRGWTLQELLAPREVLFYSSTWNQIGTRRTLRYPISRITSIDVSYLAQTRRIWSASISARMSWLSRRQTTRIEDMAYCMLGIFDINMPLIYGEGSKAFLRLQEEIVRTTDDQTIFCWDWNEDDVPDVWCSVLAPNVRVFTDGGRYVGRYDPAVELLSYGITNSGLRIRLPVVRGLYCYCAMLAVVTTDMIDPGARRRVCLPIVEGDGVYRRYPFPGRPFLLHHLMAGGTMPLYLVCRETRALAGLPGMIPLGPLQRFDLGFYITFWDSWTGPAHHGGNISIEYLTPQVAPTFASCFQPATPHRQKQKPVYSAIGWSTARQPFQFLIMRIKLIDKMGGSAEIVVLMTVRVQGNKRMWHCELVGEEYLEPGEKWDQLKEGSEGREGPERSVAATPYMMVVLDKEIHGTRDSIFKMVYVVFRGSDGKSYNRWQEFTKEFNSASIST